MSETIVITQGQHAVSADPNTVISTVLGSCVACCLWDHVSQLGGMNHMLLAQRQHNNLPCDMAGVNAMELLINELLKLGARRDRLQAKVFGGARMVDGLSEIGAKNISFTLGFLERENITCTAQSVGGTAARQVMFWPVIGVVRQKMTRSAPLRETVTPPANTIEGNGLELL
ncbi:chemotaxis protein CheD [Sulfitobacter delicatus]|uniref:Probable chemoreceptor glutamine deamidase CheD n=1 Tax=Sulfitobacter delicatus TaxID=218672 RepID=A0A1G7R5T0_9RHOB|nr:chemotaxis protein CheD [Sulfitobacter delicatus]SDG06093.1 chemotaxis protein CheD [Sulfitobacter delicatus]